MSIQKRASRRSVSSAPKIKPKRKMKRHKWELERYWAFRSTHRCVRCGASFVVGEENPYDTPPVTGCIPALKNL